MEYIFNTRLRGNIALTDSYHTNLALQKDNTHLQVYLGTKRFVATGDRSRTDYLSER